MFVKLSRLLFLCFSIAAFIFRKRGKRSGVCLIKIDAIGDFFVWLDTAKEYKRIFKNKKTVLLANSIWADCARALDYWDEVVALDLDRLQRDIGYFMSVARKLRSMGFEVAVNTSYSRSIVGDSLVVASGASRRLGAEGDLSNMSRCVKWFTNFFFTRLAATDSKPKAEIIRNSEVFNGLFSELYSPALPMFDPRLTVTTKCKLPDSPYFVIFPGASWSGRCWELANFAKLAEKVHARFGWIAVLGGGGSDQGICTDLKSRLTFPCSNLAGKLTLLEFTELVRNASLLVGNETSAVHIATAVKTPSVCILGGGHFGRFVPYPNDFDGIKPNAVDHKMDCFGCGWRCSVKGYIESEAVPCIKNISVQSVFDAALAAVETVEKLKAHK